MVDLKERGLLESTLVVWMGEFGRTPAINPRQGRDHYPNAWSVVLGGGGIKGGQVIGKTSKDGMLVDDRPAGIPDLLATICLRWASTRRSRTCRTSVGPFASSILPANRFRRHWLEVFPGDLCLLADISPPGP